MVNRAKTADLILALGGDQLLMGQHEKAIARFREAIQLNPNCGEAYAWLGKAYREIGRLGEAEQAFRDAIRLRAGFGLAHYNLGLVYVARGDFDRALEQYEVLHTIHPVRAERLLDVIKEQHSQAPRPLADRPNSQDAKGESAVGLFDKPLKSEGERGSQRAESRPAETVADVFEHPAAEAVELEPQGDREQPAPVAEEQPSREETAPSAEHPAAPAETPTVSSPEVEKWKRAVASDPRDAQAHWQLGQTYLAAGEHGLAAEAIEKAITNRVDFAGSHPDSVRETVEMCLALGLCYERLGRFQEAAQTYEQALDADPENAETHLRLGLVMLVLNNRREAVQHYRDLARLAPQRATPLLQRLLRVVAK